MTTMFAVTTDGQDGFATTTVPRPSAGPIEVLIRVEAAGINPADSKSRHAPPPGSDAPPGPAEPRILGWDLAGVVAEVGPGVTRFAVGHRVFGMRCFPPRLARTPNTRLRGLARSLAFRTVSRPSKPVPFRPPG